MLQAAVVVLALVTALCRLLVASRLELFGDEAFYWQCSRALAAAYADHPPLTALLVRAGTALLGDTTLGVRVGFVALSLAVAPLVYALARPRLGSRGAWLAAGLSQLLPSGALAGALAVPDGLLAVLSLAGLVALDDALRRGRTASWLAFGLCGALGLATHLRFLLFVASAGLVLVGTADGRRALRRPAPWAALGVLTLGLAPLLVFNLEHDFAPLRYQFVERHGVREGLAAVPAHLLEQLLLVSPALYAVLLATLVDALGRARRGDGRDLVPALFAAVPLLVFLLGSPLTDARHDSSHWPLPAYLPLCALAPALLERLARAGGWRRALAFAAPGLAGLTVLVVLLDLGAGVVGLRTLHRPFAGWDALRPAVAARLAELDDAHPGEPPLLVGDNYLLAGQLAFGSPERDVYTLDHPRNEVDGRGLQGRLWERDAAALARRAGEPVLLVVQITATGYDEREAWRAAVLEGFASAELLEKVEVELSPTRKRRFELYAARVGAGPEGAGQ